MNARNVSSLVAVGSESSSENVVCEASGAKTPVSVVPVVSKPSFSAVVAEQNVSADIPVVHDEMLYLTVL